MIQVLSFDVSVFIFEYNISVHFCFKKNSMLSFCYACKGTEQFHAGLVTSRYTYIICLVSKEISIAFGKYESRQQCRPAECLLSSSASVSATLVTVIWKGLLDIGTDDAKLSNLLIWAFTRTQLRVYLPKVQTFLPAKTIFSDIRASKIFSSTLKNGMCLDDQYYRDRSQLKKDFCRYKSRAIGFNLLTSRSF